jgi:hypothetical protein
MEWIITDNTAFTSTPLFPELQVCLLKDNSPLWQYFRDTAGNHTGSRPYWN